MSNNPLKKEYNAIDILKVILAVMVVVIHSGIDKTVVSPVLRTAVPLFFIVSGYLFFTKLQRFNTKAEKNKALLTFVKRNLFLYLFWAVVQLPLRYFTNSYHRLGALRGAGRAALDILTGNAFTGAWFILSLFIGTVIIYWLSGKLSAGWIVIIALPFYLFCCLATNYWLLFGEKSVVQTIALGYRSVTGMYIYNSLPVALFWVSLGKWIAERKAHAKTNTLIYALCAGGILLAVEHCLVVAYALKNTDDCFVMLAVVCPVIFMLILKSKYTFTTRFRIREYSILLYVMHGSLGRIFEYLLKIFGEDFIGRYALKILLTVVSAFIISRVIIWLREKYNLKILKYAY